MVLDTKYAHKHRVFDAREDGAKLPRKKANFSADDVFRIINGAQRAGLKVSRCEVSPDGQIVLFSSADASARLPVTEETAPKQSVLERWLADENAR